MNTSDSKKVHEASRSSSENEDSEPESPVSSDFNSKEEFKEPLP